MKTPKFGTDGVRAIANSELTPEFALQIGLAAGRWLAAQDLPHRVVIGRDTRRSGTLLGSALSAGLASAGVDVVDMGVVPTPAVSFAARTGDFGLGVVISASHNPAPDNGIKLLGANGGKLLDDAEGKIIAFVGQPFEDRPVGAAVGSISEDSSLKDAYLDFLISLVPERLDGMKVAVDAANGAAYELGVEVLMRLGVETMSFGDGPDGMNINAEGGATKPEFIQDICAQRGADVGIAFDGDADRAVFSDGQGRLVNGDRTIAIWAAHWKPEPAVVIGTVMSNTGFENYMVENGIRVERAKVGDKYVAELMAKTGAKIGGEQSGHIIFPHNGPTGDGLATALELLRVLVREGKTLAEMYDRFENWPQLLVNVEVADRATWDAPDTVKESLRQADQMIDGSGRLNVRASGTQPMVRVMVESSDEALCEAVADKVVGTLIRESGGKVYSRVDLAHALGD